MPVFSIMFLRWEYNISTGINKKEVDFEDERTSLFAKIGELEMERDWLKKSTNSSVYNGT